jgi:hypothetical protein
MNQPDLAARLAELRRMVADAERDVEACRDRLVFAQLVLAGHRGALTLLEEVMAATPPVSRSRPERKPRRNVMGMMREVVRSAGDAGISAQALGEACGLKPARASDVIDSLLSRKQITQANGLYRVNEFDLKAALSRA